MSRGPGRSRISKVPMSPVGRLRRVLKESNDWSDLLRFIFECTFLFVEIVVGFCSCCHGDVYRESVSWMPSW